MGAPTRHRGRSRYPTRSRNAGATGAAPATFNPLTDWTTDPVHGVWASDPLWTPPADGGAVSSWRNGGTVGGDFTQGTGAAQPTFTASSGTFGGRAIVAFDGTDDSLGVDPSDFSQPCYLLVIGRWRSLAASSTVMVATRYASYDSDSGLRANSTSFDLGLATPFTGPSSSTSPHLFHAVINDASSSLAVDGGTASTGTVGSNAIVRMGLGSNSTGQYAPVDLALVLWFTSDPTGQAEWAAFKAWVTSFYGITVA